MKNEEIIKNSKLEVKKIINKWINEKMKKWKNEK